MKSFRDLIKSVHQKGICQQCGGCVSFCNSIEHEVIGFKDPNGPPVYLNKDKCLKCALCYLICPQTHALEEEINRTYKFSDFTTMPLGFFFNIYSCQSTDKDFLHHGTDGGVVNTIINFLLEKEVIDGAIVAKTLGPFSREAYIAETKEDLIKSSGIKLDISPQLEEIQKLLKQGNTYCLLGSSGVGKTTLINKLIGGNIFATAAVREKDGKGRHVTARRQLVILEKGGMIIDTPGMRELGNIGVETGLEKTFSDIIVLAQDCRFKNCTHMDEPGCSVTKAVKEEKLSEKRYQNYLKIRRESEYYEMSYLDKRKKDKKFGKIYREAKEKYKKKI